MSTITITLRDLRFYAYHGVLPQEAAVGNEFVVDLKLVNDASGLESMVEDNRESLEETISYADVFETVREEMERRCELLETLSIRIAVALRDRFPRILSGLVRVTKLAPPIPACSGTASVAYRF